jgi:hypothetical protein
MRLASLILGIIAVVGMFIGFIPCLGWFNWLNLPLAAVGIILGAIDYNNQSKTYLPSSEYDPNYIVPKKQFPIGLLLCGIAFAFGLIRLIAGGGIV